MRRGKANGLRCALLGLYHEANTFSPIKADLNAFAQADLARGPEIIERYVGTPSTVGGYLDAADQLGLEIEPLVFARAIPSGVITATAFTVLADEMTEALRVRGPWDAVLLALHGAAAADGVEEVDGEIAARVRAVVGPSVPIGVVLDLHANLSPRLVQAVDVSVGYRTNPHVDAGERARECATLVAERARGARSLAQALVRVPVVSSVARQDTEQTPMRELIDHVDDVTKRPGVRSASLFAAYPYADVPQLGMSVIVLHEDRDEATVHAHELAEHVWTSRASLQDGGVSVNAAVSRLAQGNSTRIVLLDAGDNIGGGAPGDSLVLFDAARRRGVHGLLQTVVDPAIARALAEAGVGARFEGDVGARQPHSAGTPLPVSGSVRNVTDGRFFEPGTTHGGFRRFSMGTTVTLETQAGDTLIISEQPTPNVSLEQFASQGVDVSSYRGVIAKGVNAPRAVFRGVADELIVTNTPGITPVDFQELHFAHRPRPLYPFEQDAAWEAPDGRA